MMTYDRAYIEQFIGKFVRPRRPDLESSLLMAFDNLTAEAAPSPQSWEALVDAASDKHANVYEIGTEFLGAFAERDLGALKMVQEMAVSQHAHIRHNSLLCLTAKTPLRVSAEIIRERLKDKSSRVRRKAADLAERLLLREVTAAISEAIQVETDGATSDVMRSALKALRGQ